MSEKKDTKLEEPTYDVSLHGIYKDWQERGDSIEGFLDYIQIGMDTTEEMYNLLEEQIKEKNRLIETLYKLLEKA